MITYRIAKGSALTWQELDDNFATFDGLDAIGQRAVYPLFAPDGEELNFMARSLNPTYPLTSNLQSDVMSGTSLSKKFDQPNDVTFVQFEIYTCTLKDVTDFVASETVDGSIVTDAFSMVAINDFHKIEKVMLYFSSLIYDTVLTVRDRSTVDALITEEKILAGENIIVVSDGEKYGMTVASDSYSSSGVGNILGDGTCVAHFRMEEQGTGSPYRVYNKLNGSQYLSGAPYTFVTELIFADIDPDIMRYPYTGDKMTIQRNGSTDGTDANTNHIGTTNWTVCCLVGNQIAGTNGITDFVWFYYPSSSGNVVFGANYLTDDEPLVDNSGWHYFCEINGVLEACYPDSGTPFIIQASIVKDGSTITVYRDDIVAFTVLSAPTPTGGLKKVGGGDTMGDDSHCWHNMESIRIFNRVLSSSELATVKEKEERFYGQDISGFNLTVIPSEAGEVTPPILTYEELTYNANIIGVESDAGGDKIVLDISEYIWNEEKTIDMGITDSGSFVFTDAQIDLLKVT